MLLPVLYLALEMACGECLERFGDRNLKILEYHEQSSEDQNAGSNVDNKG